MLARFHPDTIFSQVYAATLASILLALALLLGSTALVGGPVPTVSSLADIAAALQGEDPSVRGLKAETAHEARVLDWGSRESRDLRTALATLLAVDQDRLIVELPRIGPRLMVGRPDYVFGDFRVALKRPDGSWRIVEPVSSLKIMLLKRLLLFTLLISLVVLLFAYVLAKRLTAPVLSFAAAAERLGRDSAAPELLLEGPRELRAAAQAFNTMQVRLRRYVDDRTTLLSALAHDIRTPLMRMTFQLESLDEPLRGRLAKQLAEMREMTEGVMAFVNVLSPASERDRIGLGSLVEALCDDLLDSGAPVVLANSIDAIVLGDSPGLKSVFRNLIQNAVAYGGSARVSMSVQDGEACVCVDDEGPGLSGDQLERVFEPFYRVDASRSRETGGVGLGLAIVRTVVLAHGGRAWLSNRESGGLRAEVRIPLAQKPA